MAEAHVNQSHSTRDFAACAARALGVQRLEDRARIKDQRSARIKDQRSGQIKDQRRVQIQDQPMQAGSGSKLRRVTPADLQLDLQEY